MSFSLTQIKKFAQNSIKNIIPLDDESIDEMIKYTLSNFKSREAISDHLLDILGPSDEAFKFASTFCDMLFGTANNAKPQTVDKTITAIPDFAKPQVKPTIKSNKQISNKQKTSGIRLVKSVPVSMLDKNSKGRMANNSSKGSTTSEMFDMKPRNVETQKIKNKEVKKKLDSIKDLDDVLLQLELADSEKNSSEDTRICNCNATRHPLYEMYPNCLYCGKIICAKEGFQPCSFCGHSLISNDERLQMLEIINQQKQDLENEANKVNTISNEPRSKSKKKNVIKITLNSTGQNNFKVQEQFVKQIEKQNQQKKVSEEIKKQEQETLKQNQKDLDYYKAVHKKDGELIKAEERLAMLLSFQDNGAERTKIIDNAADFELPTGCGSLWASPVERILQLKRQQKQQAKLQEQDARRSGRGSTVMDMSINNGKVIFHDRVDDDSSMFKNLSDDEEISQLQKQINVEKLQQFHRDTQNVYDYDNFDKTLIKPVYKGNLSKIKDSNKDIMADLPELGTVVQLGDVEQQESQLFNMIGV